LAQLVRGGAVETENFRPFWPAFSCIEPVSSSGSLKTGIFCQVAGEYWPIAGVLAEKRSLWRMTSREKPAVGGPFSQLTEKFSQSHTGWLATQC
jgi:hypothetical protein